MSRPLPSYHKVAHSRPPFNLLTFDITYGWPLSGVSMRRIVKKNKINSQICSPNLVHVHETSAQPNTNAVVPAAHGVGSTACFELKNGVVGGGTKRASMKLSTSELLKYEFHFNPWNKFTGDPSVTRNFPDGIATRFSSIRIRYHTMNLRAIDAARARRRQRRGQLLRCRHIDS
ncbi:hypothetical protein EVAR_55196_1 [Eumeta japonica]|uniref:Uncharacterized protein n=1 Tax=Eumeta variegata TaxID=151549 RepID=A0A4C1ZFW6_EUMVA|nr:hypothetical protein EVAR_55196_1 [Eumeta japonica]